MKKLFLLCALAPVFVSATPHQNELTNVTKRCICHSNDDEYTVLKLHLIHIDAKDAKSLCDDIIVSTDEFLSISIATDSRTNSLILAGGAYEVHLLEEHIVRHIDVSPL